jgi:hypothetical protein
LNLMVLQLLQQCHHALGTSLGPLSRISVRAALPRLA